MFKKAGHFEGKILETMIAEPRFNKDDPNAFDVCLKVEGPDGQSDWWHGEFSSKLGRGNFANRTQAQITVGDLRKIGFEGEDLTKLDEQLNGKTIPFTVEAREYDGKTYYDVKYIGGGDFRPKAIDPSGIQARVAAITGSATTAAPAPEPRPEPQATSSAPNDPWG